MGILSDRARKVAEATGGQFISPAKIPLNKTIRVRILSPKPVEGYQVWGEDARGQRRAFLFSDVPSAEDMDRAFGQNFTLGTNQFNGGPEEPALFIALAVWDYASEAVRILQITQRTLMRNIDDIAEKEEYDPIQDWDLDIKREEKSYPVLPVPIKPASKAAVDAAWAAVQAGGFSLEKAVQVIPVGGDEERPF